MLYTKLMIYSQREISNSHFYMLPTDVISVWIVCPKFLKKHFSSSQSFQYSPAEMLAKSMIEYFNGMPISTES